jgi:hypothetical protein
MIFGPSPKAETVPRYIYENKEEGFYNFYIDYKNIYFLPDWFSEFLQVKLHVCLDITVLETVREVLFVGLMVYSQIVILALSWYIYINRILFLGVICGSCGLDRGCVTRNRPGDPRSKYYWECVSRNT